MSRKLSFPVPALLLAVLLPACSMSLGETAAPDPNFATVEVAGIGMDPDTQAPIVLLRDPESGKVMPIWIGIAEAEAIARSLHGVEVPRPMTHDLLASMAQSLGARVEEVVIHEAREGTYFAVVRLLTNARGRRVELDSRPSDGMALALRTGAPIRVARSLLLDSADDERPAPRRRTA